MTARELAMLARHIIKTYPDYYQLFSLKEFAYRKHKFINRNPLLGLVPGVDGLKTGFIKEAGYGMVASAKQDNRRLIVVVNGLATADERRDEARRLLEWGFRSFSEAKLYDAGEVVGHARVWGGQRMYVPLVGEGDVNVWLPRNPAEPEAQGAHRLPVAAEAAAEEGRSGGHAARHHRRRGDERGAALRGRGRGARPAPMRRGLRLDPVLGYAVVAVT